MKRIFLVITIISLVFTSCKKEEGCTDFAATNYNSDAEQEDGTCKYNLIINFTHTVDGNALETDQMIYSNAASQNYSVQTLRYLLSDITIHSANGTSTIVDEVHFITISDPSSFNLEIQDLNSSNYTAISFTIGLDSLKNITDNYLNETTSWSFYSVFYDRADVIIFAATLGNFLANHTFRMISRKALDIPDAIITEHHTLFNSLVYKNQPLLL